MFTGIVESVGTIEFIENTGTNKTFWISSSLSTEFKIDQSVAHNGVCLTIEEINSSTHRVTAIEETLKKTNMHTWQKGSLVNMERCLPMNGRLDGHLVQGHVDTSAKCILKTDLNGSWEYRFEFDKSFGPLVIEKGSICLNGISLTIFNVSENAFTVAIIPYTYEHTNIQQFEEGTLVNIEFDMIGKYVNRMQFLKDNNLS